MQRHAEVLKLGRGRKLPEFLQQNMVAAVREAEDASSPEAVALTHPEAQRRLMRSNSPRKLGPATHRDLVVERQVAAERHQSRVNSGPSHADAAPRLGNWKANWGYKSTQTITARDRFSK
jgi:hypothetical protein